MKKKHYLLTFFFLFFSILKSISQTAQLSTYSQISIITVGPGEKLYERFGHTAIRVKDPVLNLDLIYNYGIFDFNAPNFYANFTKGKLIYKLVGYPFAYFKEDYKKDKRWIKEQLLNLTQEQKQQFFLYLYNNALPKNANYQYDPFFENCATKIPYVINSILGNKVSFDESFAVKNNSIRSLMNTEIHWNTWGSLGINLALGSKLDKIATPKEYMYLPKYVYTSLEKSFFYKKNQPAQLVKQTRTILNFTPIKPTPNLISPLLIFSILLLVGIYLTYKDIKNNTRTKWFDFLLFFSTGIIGILIVFLWFFTNHSTTPNNFNFLWAFAPNSFIAFFLLKNSLPKWITKYLILLIFLLVLIPILWFCKIQSFAFSLLPFILLLVVRYLFLQKNTK